MGLLNAGRDTVKRGSGKPRAVVYRSGGNAPAPIAVGMKRKQEKRDANRARYLREAGMGDMVRKEKSQTKSLDRMAVQSLRQSQALGSKAHVSRGLRGTNVARLRMARSTSINGISTASKRATPTASQAAKRAAPSSAWQAVQQGRRWRQEGQEGQEPPKGSLVTFIV